MFEKIRKRIAKTLIKTGRRIGGIEQKPRLKNREEYFKQIERTTGSITAPTYSVNNNNVDLSDYQIDISKVEAPKESFVDWSNDRVGVFFELDPNCKTAKILKNFGYTGTEALKIVRDENLSSDEEYDDISVAVHNYQTKDLVVFDEKGNKVNLDVSDSF